MSAAEMITLLIVGIVVVGPKKLPTMMRTAGQWVSKMRRMSSDLRSQSGIDRIIREEMTHVTLLSRELAMRS